MQFVALLGAVYVLVSYALIGKKGTHQFDVANAAVFMPIVVANIEVGAWAAVLLSLSFGLIACIRIWRRYV